METDIPTPEEINRVTQYLQEKAADAQRDILAANQASADLAQATADALVRDNDVSGVAIYRKSWDDESIPWQRRGEIESIRLDFTDGTQVLVEALGAGVGLELSITPP